MELEEHYVLLQEPGSKYIGHITPASGHASVIVDSLITYLYENNISCEKICAIGCDGTVVNTGKQGGIIKLFEGFLGRPVHWFICLLHLNELPLRHIFSYLDGPTTGPKTSKGIISKEILFCENLEIVNFNPIKIDQIVVNDKKDFSTDQLLLYNMCT